MTFVGNLKENEDKNMQKTVYHQETMGVCQDLFGAMALLISLRNFIESYLGVEKQKHMQKCMEINPKIVYQRNLFISKYVFGIIFEKTCF